MESDDCAWYSLALLKGKPRSDRRVVVVVLNECGLCGASSAEEPALDRELDRMGIGKGGGLVDAELAKLMVRIRPATLYRESDEGPCRNGASSCTPGGACSDGDSGTGVGSRNKVGRESGFGTTSRSLDGPRPGDW